ncbi:MAG: hypothetical protein ACD_38C00047G0020 [uncultured bacterium]|nr:MAG: hypothetical protein ACD_38C00047G0020 [uncultured bacterium]OGE21085.1 MAG: hypothetical protein A2778_02550 [Candidatus Daviesbacteria bacterium RIFCSPHIGHO2_01_FULL_40_24]HCE30790.1 hypothetical protein [Candidatus Daviesbacteria bacterium]
MKWMLPLVIIMFLWPATILAQTNTQSDSLYQINQKVCDRFEGDMVKLAAIMEELRRRKGVTETRVAFGGVDTQIKSADYQVTFAAEALAFQRAQKFSSKSVLKANLLGLQSKILRTKSEVRKALNETE